MALTLSSGRIEDLDSPEAHETLIRFQWREFAAFAFGKYKSQGRGAVVIDLRVARKTEAGFSIPTRYVAQSSDQLARLGGWPSEEIQAVIDSYDPSQDVVFLIVRLDGSVFHYNVSDELTPLQAS